jgi:hypothetical protein
MSLLRGALCLLGLLPALALAEAAPAPRPLDQFSFWLGGFEARSDTTVTALARSGDSAASGSVNLERDLGLDQRQPVSHARLDFLLGQSQ